MEKYRAFISYRKTHAEKAELVKTSLIEKRGFQQDEIFLDKHDIGPEYFDKKLYNAVKNSSSLVLIVTRDCFKPKEEGDDWYLEEIQTALDNGITIIPVLFDGINSLDTKSIRKELEKSFTEEEIEKLIKVQSIRYDFDWSEATFEKLSRFIEKTDKPDTSTKLRRIAKVICAIIAVFAIVFAFFVGVGFLWGYYSSNTDEKSVLLDNTRIEGNTAVFEFGGLIAKYDLDQDTIVIDLEEFNGEIPESSLEILAHSCSVSGSIMLFKKNVGTVKYLKYIKGGSKPSKIARAGVTVAALLGSFIGFSQGSEWGRTLRQEKQALALYPKLKNKAEWSPVFITHLTLYDKYFKLQSKHLYSENIYSITWCEPYEEVEIARNAGLTKSCIVCRYNNWEIGKGNAQDLYLEKERSKNIPKDVVITVFKDSTIDFKQLNLPAGIVGIRFNFPYNNINLNHQDSAACWNLINYYNTWKQDQVTDTH